MLLLMMMMSWLIDDDSCSNNDVVFNSNWPACFELYYCLNPNTISYLQRNDMFNVFNDFTDLRFCDLFRYYPMLPFWLYKDYF